MEINDLKKIFRPIYYLCFDGLRVKIKKPAPLAGLKWIIHHRFGRAYYKGYYEPEIVSFLINEVTNGDCFFDIGGHAGYFTYLFSKLSPSGNVFTFEPDPENVKFISQIILLNEIINVQVVQTAVGNENGSLFLEPGLTSSMGRIVKRGEVPVPVVKIDDFVSKTKIERVDFMKIDVEGFGGEVLKGASNTIKTFRPRILMELHSPGNERDILSGLSEMDYTFFNLQGQSTDINEMSCRFYLAKPS